MVRKGLCRAPAQLGKAYFGQSRTRISASLGEYFFRCGRSSVAGVPRLHDALWKVQRRFR